jgi:hypothetical protein
LSGTLYEVRGTSRFRKSAPSVKRLCRSKNTNRKRKIPIETHNQGGGSFFLSHRKIEESDHSHNVTTAILSSTMIALVLFGVLFTALFLAFLQLKYSMNHGPTTLALLKRNSTRPSAV